MKQQTLFAIVALTVETIALKTVAQNDTYPVLRTLDGHSYTNAEVSSASASCLTVLYDGGGSRIPFTNLPPEIQHKYHFDPAAAAAADQAEAEKQARARARIATAQAQEAALEVGIDETNRLHILDVRADGSYDVLVSHKGPTGLWEGRLQQIVRLRDLPFKVSDFVARYTSLSGGQGGFGNTIATSRGHGAQTAAAAATLGNQNAAIAAQQLADMRAVERSVTTILAGATKKQFGGVTVWRYVGPVPASQME